MKHAIPKPPSQPCSSWDQINEDLHQWYSQVSFKLTQWGYWGYLLKYVIQTVKCICRNCLALKIRGLGYYCFLWSCFTAYTKSLHLCWHACGIWGEVGVGLRAQWRWPKTTWRYIALLGSNAGFGGRGMGYGWGQGGESDQLGGGSGWKIWHEGSPDCLQTQEAPVPLFGERRQRGL